MRKSNITRFFWCFYRLRRKSRIFRAGIRRWFQGKLKNGAPTKLQLRIFFKKISYNFSIV